MSTLVSTTRLPARRSERLSSLSGWWRAASEAWQLRRRQRAMERRLPALDEATLRDLGIARGELLSYWAESEGLVAATRERVLAQLDRRLGL